MRITQPLGLPPRFSDDPILGPDNCIGDVRLPFEGADGNNSQTPGADIARGNAPRIDWRHGAKAIRRDRTFKTQPVVERFWKDHISDLNSP